MVGFVIPPVSSLIIELYQSMFLEMQFNALLREFYEKVMPQRFSSVNVVKIDAGYSKEVIITQLGIVLAATAS